MWNRFMRLMKVAINNRDLYFNVEEMYDLKLLISGTTMQIVQNYSQAMETSAIRRLE